MPINICKVCNAEFDAPSKRPKYCSERCYKDAANARKRERARQQGIPERHSQAFKEKHSQAMKDEWNRLTPEEKQQRINSRKGKAGKWHRDEAYRKEVSKKTRAFFADNPPNFGERKCELCGESYTARHKQQRFCSTVCQRRALQLRKYDLDGKGYEALARAQHGKCAICGNSNGQLVVDHCHTTGKVRALLCSPCNTGLGHFRDNPALLQSALHYLSRFHALNMREKG